MARPTRKMAYVREAADSIVDAATLLRRYSHVPLAGALARIIDQALGDIGCASRALEASIMAGVAGGRHATA
jgi:hypothetical protein